MLLLLTHRGQAIAQTPENVVLLLSVTSGLELGPEKPRQAVRAVVQVSDQSEVQFTSGPFLSAVLHANKLTVTCSVH